MRRPRYPYTATVMKSVDRYADAITRYTLALRKGHKGRARIAGATVVRLRERLVAQLGLRSRLDREARPTGAEGGADG